MTRLQEAIELGLVLGIVHGLVQPGHSVPVVPNFTRETNDDWPYGDNFYRKRNYKFDGL